MQSIMSRAALCVAFALTLPSVSAAQHLPLLAVPEHYLLRFEPDLAREVFAGDVTINIHVLRPTDEIVLNAAELEFDNVQVRAEGRIQDADVSVDASNETAVLRFPQPLAVGGAELRIQYRGILNRQLRGFYISEANGRKYAVTQLEATDARRMFPSFDEPEYKATFDVIAVVDRDDYAISNGSVLSVEPGPSDAKRTFRFARTPRMSTYLVALAIGDFECVEGKAASTPLRVCVTPGKQRLAAYAVDATAAVLEYYNQYFAIDYPFAKLDQVAIPDFAAGAMENTGAIFYRESILLVDPEAASLAARKRAALVIAHEIAHQWFGNLVTMRWWDDLWLNEGFATWMEAKAVAAWKSEWSVQLDEVQWVHDAMAIDGLTATRPIRMRAETPEEINELFDAIAYEKAAAILRMVEAYVGEQAFRGGVNAYLDAYQYDNATAEDFWTLVTRATGKPVDRIMASFVTQPGIPVVDVTASCVEGRTQLRLTQERYSVAPEAGAAAETWAIPVCLRLPPGEGDANADSTHCELLVEPTARRTLNRCVPWLVANADADGYYRTGYGAPLLHALSEAAAITPAETIALVSDEWALVRAGRHDIGRFLEVVASLTSGIGTADVAESMGERLTYVHEYLTTAESRDRFERWVRGQLRPALQHLARTPGSAATEPRMRAALMLALGAAGRDKNVLSGARQSVEKYLRGSSTAVHPTVLDALVTLAAQTGNSELYEAYLSHSRTAETPEEKYRFLYALAAFRDPQLLQRTVDYALSDDVRAQDRARLIAAVLQNPAGREVAWSRLQERWDALQGTLGAFGGLSRIIEGLGAFCSTPRAAEIRRFFASHPAPAAERTLRQTLERIQNCAAIATTQQSQLTKWLSAAVSGDGR